MNKKLGIGIAAATLAAGLVYLYKRRSARRTQENPAETRARHRTDVFSKAKAMQQTPAM